MSTDTQEIPLAMDAPESDVTPLTLTMAGELLTLSREGARKRMIQKVHKDEADTVHRMFNALQPGTYIPPHRHLDPAKSETIIVISGSVLFVRFSDDGEIGETTLVQPGTEIFGIDVAPHVYHTYVVLKPDTLVFEVKTGPFDAATDKEIPQWAPAEDDEGAEPYLLSLLKELSERANAAAAAAKAAGNGDGTEAGEGEPPESAE